MSDPNAMLLQANLRPLKTADHLAEHGQLAREAAGRDESYHASLPRLTELGVATGTVNLPMSCWWCRAWGKLPFTRGPDRCRPPRHTPRSSAARRWTW
jgi:hypothetical protein